MLKILLVSKITNIKYLVSVDSVNAFTVDTRVFNAIVVVVLAIFAPSSWQTPAFVAVWSVHANAPILTRISQAFIDGSVTQISSVARMTFALERIRSTYTVPMYASVVVALVVVDLAPMSRETRSTIASKRIVRIATTSAVHARIFVAAIGDDFFALFTRESDGTSASEAIDEIGTNAAVFARIKATFINVRLAMSASESCKERGKKH